MDNPWAKEMATIENVPLEEHRFPCPACGADLRFAPGTDNLACDHCGHAEPIQAPRGALRELDLRSAEKGGISEEDLEETRTARCGSCGAEVEFAAGVHAETCPFCASPLVTDTGANRHIKPQGQLPFLIAEEEARQALRKWLGRLWFAPSDLKKYASAERALDGIYVPYWTYDAETRSRYTGQRGTVHHKTKRVPVMVKGKRRMQNVTTSEVRWRPASGRVARDFDDVLVPGTTSLPKRFVDAIAPWDLSALLRYDPRYLAGFRAEAYGRSVQEGYEDARAIMNSVITQDVRRDIGGDRQKITRLETDVGRLTFKHVLLPVWMAAYRYRGKSYRFVVNARTGAVEGERPWSPGKIAIAVVLGLIVALAIAWLQISQN
ncbi:primosomal protein N' (replication factor Y) - superfamily II helicase [Amaricoccus macauensis]|uniref:primosomal protein N' (replication factor Y) - superfamily II helicase n=1 Tax=Amaricoccus macauensis TaxID=57001 RepID=UPI003C79F6B1